MHLLYAQRPNLCPGNPPDVISEVFHLDNQLMVGDAVALVADTEMSLTFGSTCSFAVLAMWVKEIRQV